MTRLARLASTALATAALGATITSGSHAADGQSRVRTQPRWLPAAERQTLQAVFGGATPIHTRSISYARKVAVVFEFDHVVICGACSAPSNALLPRGRVIRVSYDRRTHRVTGGLEFCESRSSYPPRAFCLRR